MRRITTAREQVEMLSPWLIEAADPGLFPPSKKEKGQKPPREVPPDPHDAWADKHFDELPYWQGEDWRNQDGGSFNSRVRPPIPQSDIPHPQDLYGPEKWEQMKQTLKDPEHDPHGVLPDGVTFEDLVRNHGSHLDNMTPEEDWTGRQWYPGAHDMSKNVSDMTTGDHGRTVAEWSAFSPKNRWDNNIENGMQFSLNYTGQPSKHLDRTKVPTESGFGMPTMNQDNAKAIRHAPGDTYKDFLTGPKRQSFYSNIMDHSPMRDPRPGQNPVEDGGYYDMPTNPYTGEGDWRMHPEQTATMDTHHVRMTNTPHGATDEQLVGLPYETPPYFDKKVTANGRTYNTGYELQNRANWEATRRRNASQPDALKHTIPMQNQAGPWGKFKNDLDGANYRLHGEVWPDEGALAKGVQPGKNPPPRGQGLGIGEFGPQTEYDATGKQPPVEESKKKFNYPRYQQDPSYAGDPDYNAAPSISDPSANYLEPNQDPSHGPVYPDSPQKKLQPRQPVVPDTGWEATPRDPRNRAEDLRITPNYLRRSRKRNPMRIRTAKEYVDMLSPWAIEAGWHDTNYDPRVDGYPEEDHNRPSLSDLHDEDPPYDEGYDGPEPDPNQLSSPGFQEEQVDDWPDPDHGREDHHYDDYDPNSSENNLDHFSHRIADVRPTIHTKSKGSLSGPDLDSIIKHHYQSNAEFSHADDSGLGYHAVVAPNPQKNGYDVLDEILGVDGVS